MKRLVGIVFFLITSILCEAQLQKVFTIKKIIIGEQHTNDASLERYLFNYEMDESCIKQGNFSTWFFSKTNDTTLVAEGKYKDGYLDDTCRWFFVGTKILYMQTVFSYPQNSEDASKFTVYYSGRPFCEKACKDGLFEIYFPGATKQLKERLTYVKDKPNGIHEGFFDNGKLAFKYEFVNGVQDGFYENYDEDGFIKNKGYVNSQTEECYMEQYADRGRFKNRIMKTKAGQPVYDSCIFKNNRMSYRKYYNGKSIDSSFEFYYNGQLLKEEVYDASGNGYFKKYYDNGTLQASATYKNRLLDGPILNYYQNGHKKSEENYVRGSSNGKSIEWYEAGNIKREQFYVNNKLEGYRKTYYENGKLTSSAFYKAGQLNGVQKTYNENGQILTEKIYSNGILDSEKKYKDGKEIKIETPQAMYSGNKLDRDGQGEDVGMEAYDLDESGIQKTREIKHDIIYKSKQDIECSAAFTEIKPIFDRDTFVSNFKHYLTTSEGKCLNKISNEVEFYITTTENKSPSTGQYSRVISSVTYHSGLNKKQQKAFSQFLLKEKLVYNDPDFKNSIYKLDYELSIIPNAF